MNRKTQVAICVCTYKRPKGLRRLLEALQLLDFFKNCAPGIVIVVVDNEGNKLTEELCGEIGRGSRWPIWYSVEPRRGISHARNKAILAAGDVDFIVFIDDDEIPTRSWLDELLWVQKEYIADVVSGPSVTIFQHDMPIWLRQLFKSSEFKTGDLINQAATNNVLIHKQVLERMKIFFDDRFALSGGGDAYFFEKIHMAGYKLVWARDAVVYEPLVPRRANLKWALLRRYRYGNVRMKINRDAGWDVRPKGYVFLRLGICILWNSAGLLFDVFRGMDRIVLRLAWIAQVTGGMTGLLGINCLEYAYSDMDVNGTLD